MLKPLLHASNEAPCLFLSCTSTVPARGGLSLPPLSPSFRHRRPSRAVRVGRVRCVISDDASGIVDTSKAPATVKAVVTVKKAVGGIFSHIKVTGVLDDIGDLLGRVLLLELVSAELDQKTGSEKKPIQAYAHKASQKGDDIEYEGSFTVPMDFGEIGGVLVTNEHHKEMYLINIVLGSNHSTSPQTVTCNSWVHSKFDNPTKRIFFTNKSYLPSQTPKGLSRLRAEELEGMRGDGTGERKTFERIYDYDTYNDLGDPDKSEESARPVLGGSKDFPYPRRCRTGRPRTKKDPLSESRSGSIYVPRDEAFSEVKLVTFSTTTFWSVVHVLIPLIEAGIIDADLGFPYFTTIDSLYNESVPLPKVGGLGFFRTIIPRLLKVIEDSAYRLLLFETPEMINRDKFSWFRDEEFSRQNLAGLNPFSIQLVTEFPLRSKLDPKVYGPPESAITAEIIEREIKDVMTVKEALEKKKLFMLDYHDLLLPYVHKVRELEKTTLYGSRTIFFLTQDDTLMPIVIELTRPASPTKPQWKRVFTRSRDATETWHWRLAKTHVCAHDAGYHELVSHWLRTHCCTEPYIIAANRQLSAMHPIYRLLHPHFRYTMEINALARGYLISGDGIIEKCFSPGKYSMELSSAAYGQLWRFDHEALPADLISRGMAVEDPTADHGLRLTIEDYPYASDGLLIWSAIKQWVIDYVSHYYPNPNLILEDYELQAWWTEVRTKGHADKKDEPWWPALNTPEDLVHILTTIIWVASSHHAAVNFGQYHYAGYFPNRPTIARDKMLVEDEKFEALKSFVNKPEKALLRTFPSQIQATVVMSVLDILSSHSPDEEYLGGEPEPSWAADPLIQAAFERFNRRLKVIEGIIDERNVDPKLMNRCGAGIVPYELLKPFSKPGVTGMGIPNSISI